MELRQDWRKFHSVFHPSRKLGMLDRELSQKRKAEMVSSSPIVVVVERDTHGAYRCLTAFGDGMDLSDFSGATVQELQEHHPNRIIHAVERSAVDQSIARSITQGVGADECFQDQVDTLRKAAVPVWSAGLGSREQAADGKRGASVSPVVRWDEYAQGHFLLEALKKNAGTGIFPRRFGLLIRLEGRLGLDPTVHQDFLVVLSKGRLDQFHVPDFTSIEPQRSEDLGYLARFLGDKYMIPVFGMGVPTPLWNEWISSPHPWKLLWKSWRAKEWSFSSENLGWMAWFAWKRWVG